MRLLALLVEAYSLIVLVSVVGSWVGSRHAVFEFADRLTKPVLDPIRKVLPPVGGFDLSPMLLLLGLQLVSRVLL
jgi:YggT family protein